MGKTKYLDIFNVKLIDYPFPRNVYLQSIDRSRCFEISNDELQYNQSQQSMRCCIVIAATSGKKVTLLLALRFQSSLICEKTFYYVTLAASSLKLTTPRARLKFKAVTRLISLLTSG